MLIISYKVLYSVLCCIQRPEKVGMTNYWRRFHCVTLQSIWQLLIAVLWDIQRTYIGSTTFLTSVKMCMGPYCTWYRRTWNTVTAHLCVSLYEYSL